jgi:hypothetical protein
MEQVIQVFGSLLVLAAFTAAQRGALLTTSRRYLVLNLIGSAILAVLAVRERQWGFLLLEASWALVAGLTLAQLGVSARRSRAVAGAETPAVT